MLLLDCHQTAELPLPVGQMLQSCMLQQMRSFCQWDLAVPVFRDPCLCILQAGDDEGMDPAFLGSRKSQKYGVDLSAATAANARSGDADLPTKAPLHERRARFDQVRLVIPL